MGRARRLAVVGAGWAGLAAAIEACLAGWHVTLFEAARQPGGRARSVHRRDGSSFDNGQHILIGAYGECLALMRRIGVDPEAQLLRLPLQLLQLDGSGLVLPTGRPVPAFVMGVLKARAWTWAERLDLLGHALRWWHQQFECPQDMTVARLIRNMSPRLRSQCVEPLCVAAMNTPTHEASAQVFLRVLHDALFAGRGGSDLLLPRNGLSALLPQPAMAWLDAHGARIEAGNRVEQIAPAESAVAVDGAPFDAAVLACGPHASARLVERWAPEWATTATALRHQAIATVVLHDPGLSLPGPMVALMSGPEHPAQFAFDLGALGQPAGRFAFVASAVQAPFDWSVDALADGVLRQARATFPGHFAGPGDAVLHATLDRRATFACTAGLRRPPMRLHPRVSAAGDHVEGPYPATLEGAVRSGRMALRALDVVAR